MTRQRADRSKKTAIDWVQVHQRLARTAQLAEEASQFGPEQARAVLEQRARDLARVPPAPPLATEVLEVALFLLGQERYAIETCHVREVVRLHDCTPVPGAPAFLRGVLNLRGEILALVDLRTFFVVADHEATALSRVFVLGSERAEFGILVDGALEVRMLRIDELFEPPGSTTGVGREYLRGVTSDALIVLDGTALLEDSRLFIDQGEDAGG